MIALRGIERRFVVGDQVVHALRGVDLDVAAGEYVSLMGPSGSGKSTLLHLLGLLDRPSAGTYSLEGNDVTGLDDAALARVRRERIGFVFQFFHLVPYLTATENVELPLVLSGLAPSERRERVAAALASLGLADRSEHRPDQLSGGQRQRVAIARAMIASPALLLADEPTGNLDRSSGNEVIRLLEDLHEKRGLTLVLVTHDPEMGRRARRQIRMVDGLIHDETMAVAG
ncbi:MAG: ABC transporter ATP-binding protein [Deltaproteobacteria bacterium]|nr:ABC transporter ATP-binding protein [Deltaproteobacteria bacterium]